MYSVLPLAQYIWLLYTQYTVHSTHIRNNSCVNAFSIHNHMLNSMINISARDRYVWMREFVFNLHFIFQINQSSKEDSWISGSPFLGEFFSMMIDEHWKTVGSTNILNIPIFFFTSSTHATQLDRWIYMEDKYCVLCECLYVCAVWYNI